MKPDAPIIVCKTSVHVRRFMVECKTPINEKPGFNRLTGHSHKAVEEKFRELADALDFAKATSAPEAFAEVLDACCDLVWTTIGLAHNMGLPFDEGWEEVRKTNMAKIVNGQVTRREDGKILKPAGWQPPDLLTLIKKELAK